VVSIDAIYTCVVCGVQGRLPYLYSGSAAAAAAVNGSTDQLSQPPPAHMGIPALHIDHKTGTSSVLLIAM